MILSCILITNLPIILITSQWVSLRDNASEKRNKEASVSLSVKSAIKSLIRLPIFAIDAEFRDIKDIIQIQPCSGLPALKCQGRWKVDILYRPPLHSMHSKEMKPVCQKHLYTRVYCRIIHDGQDMEPNCVHWWKSRWKKCGMQRTLPLKTRPRAQSARDSIRKAADPDPRQLMVSKRDNRP